MHWNENIWRNAKCEIYVIGSGWFIKISTWVVLSAASAEKAVAFSKQAQIFKDTDMEKLGFTIIWYSQKLERP